MPIGVYTCSDNVVLERWSIRETETGARHFVGFNVVNHEGRVSTPIVNFDPDSRTGTTASGSTYTLVGRAGRDGDAEYVWGHAAKAWKVKKWQDVTPSLVPDWRMWLPKTERLALGDSEKEITAYPEAARVPTDANEVFRIESVRYRASAYVGRVADLQSCTQPISTFTGNGSILFLRPVPDDPLLRTMITTRLLLAQKIERVESVNQIPVVPPFMAVTLECLSQADDGAVEQMARFDLTFDGPDARASLAIANQPEMTIGPIRVRKRGGLWNVMVRMLPDWGDEGLMSCWHPA